MTQVVQQTCKNTVEPRGAGSAYPCSLGLPPGHDGPCAAMEIPVSVRERTMWEEQMHAAMAQAQAQGLQVPVPQAMQAPANPALAHLMPPPAPMPTTVETAGAPLHEMSPEAAAAILAQTQGQPMSFWQQQAANAGQPIPPTVAQMGGFPPRAEPTAAFPPQPTAQMPPHFEAPAMAAPPPPPPVVTGESVHYVETEPEAQWPASRRDILFMMASQIAEVANQLPVEEPSSAPVSSGAPTIDEVALVSALEETLAVEATVPRNRRDLAAVLAQGVVAAGVVVPAGALAAAAATMLPAVRCPQCQFVASMAFTMCPACQTPRDAATSPWEDGAIDYRPAHAPA